MTNNLASGAVVIRRTNLLPDELAIRKISTSGVVTTIMGVAALASAGNFPGALPASILYPAGVAIDSSTGNLYITIPDAVMVAVLPK